MKYITIGITIFIFLFGALITYGKVQNKVEVTEKKVDKVEEKVEETEDKITDNEKIDIEQSVLIKQIAETLKKLDEKLDRDKKKR